MVSTLTPALAVDFSLTLGDHPTLWSGSKWYSPCSNALLGSGAISTMLRRGLAARPVYSIDELASASRKALSLRWLAGVINASSSRARESLT